MPSRSWRGPRTVSQLLDSLGLGDDARGRIEALVENPTVETWEESHGLLLSGLLVSSGPMLTLWQAWIAVDPSAPRTGRAVTLEGDIISEWERLPDPFTICRALAFARTQAT